jgi:DNA polymerase I-like protein with 3'-5' exonuclease and polymerase domains
MQKPDFKHFIVNTWDLFESLVKYEQVVESDIICYDLETNSEIELNAVIWGIGLAFTELKGFYIPMRNKDGSKVWTEQQEQQIIQWLEKALKGRKLIGHNIIYDVLVTEYNYKFILDDYIYADTILMKHTLDEERPFGLKEIAPIILGSWATMAQDKLEENVKLNGGKFTKDQKDMYLADTEVLGEYCCWDVLLTLMLFNHFDKELEKEGLTKLFYEEEVMPLYKEVTINMKRRGFRIDVPHFQKLKSGLEKEITTLENAIYNEIQHHVTSFEQELLDDKYPVKPSGNFPKAFADNYGMALPVTKDGKVTLAKKAIELQKAQVLSDAKAVEFYDYIISKSDKAPTWISEGRRPVQESLYFSAHPDKSKIFNLSSGDHVGYLIYDCLKIEPFKFTDSGKPSTDKEVMDDLIEQYSSSEAWLEKLSNYRKLGKLLSTYVDGILDRQIDEVLYTSMLQFGTTSARFSSTNPNLQNLPSIKGEDSDVSPLVKKYANMIREGLISKKNFSLIAADFSQLEPSCFAAVSGDLKLQQVFHNGYDLYSQIAIDVEGITDASADKKSPLYLKDKYPALRNKFKAVALAIPYGSEAGQVSRMLGIDYKEATEVINNYLNAYPGLKSYMNRCNYSAKTLGFVKTKFGRIRHLAKVKQTYSIYKDQILERKFAKSRGLEKVRSEYKNLLNNAKNFCIQSLAAHIINRAMIAISREFKKNNIDGHIVLTIHDEVVCEVSDLQIDLAKNIIRDCMENTTKIEVPLYAKPVVAKNLAEAK